MLALKAALLTGIVSSLIGSLLGPPAPEGPSLTIAAFAGNGDAALRGDGGQALQASFKKPQGVAVAADGGVIVADTDNNRVRRIAPDGIVSTLLVMDSSGSAGAGKPADVAVLSDGAIVIADSEKNRVVRVAPDGATSTAVSGLNGPDGVGALPDGGFLVADTGKHRVLRVAPNGDVTTFAGTGEHGFSGDGGAATAARLEHPSDAAALADGSVLIADYDNARIRRVSADGKISTWAGRGTNATAGDGGPAALASLNHPVAIALAPDGSVLIAERDGNVIRRVASDGTIATLAGRVSKGDTGDGGLATNAKLAAPHGVAVAPSGDVLIGDTDNHRLRIVDADLVPGAAPPAGQTPSNGSGSGGGSNNGGSGSDAPPVHNDHVDTSLPSGVSEPKSGKSVAVGPVSGKIKVRLPNGEVAPLDDVESIPVGTIVDASAGAVRLVTASGGDRRQAAVFSGGRFIVRQSSGRRPVTDLTLKGSVPRCASSSRAAASAKRKPRRLWGSGKGHFRTRGGHAAATVRGTEWLTEDRCNGTLVRVRRGVVDVRDFVRHRTVRVRAGHSYFARKR